MTKRNVPVKLNEVYTIPIRDLGIHGEGIGSVEDFTVFVPGALPGEIVKASMVVVKKSYAQGKLISIEQASPERTVPECPAYHACGGCQISHLTYEGQLAVKERRVKDVMTRIGGFTENRVLPILGAAHPWNYRNKMALPVAQVTGGPVLGYYRQGSHQVVPIDGCLIQEEENNRVLRFVEGFMTRHHVRGYNEKSRKGDIRHIMARVGDRGEVMVVIVTATAVLPFQELWVEEMQKLLPEVVSIYHDVQSGRGNAILGPVIHHLWGKKTLTASLSGLSFEVSPFSFFQVHKEQAEVLYDRALAYAGLSGGETVIDAYCGTGTISLCLAKKAKRVIGIEIVKEAIEDAKKNAAFNHIDNAEFYAADAGKLMPELYEKGERPDVIVMDPVRAGCSEDVLKAAAAMEPARIVYVSCNPATFARDAKILAALGYETKEVQPVDMFPQTMHVETVSLLVRKDT
ncbi:23S rRNA (uracil(1939)-C(5))-methyltransferase RlmD [uncultured Dialister sp.]|uniref:23S rRNA (uracil(1939)-C(5))-methyltransferase RlmD n=1 Tax=uncultured Dialister sp. TaxID=278064 RepID=UPI0027DAD71E|nr:23S rRNA (uracil(1939)-C(5))-methyltransferase RlmD [uncultured Dialister sp.]